MAVQRLIVLVLSLTVLEIQMLVDQRQTEMVDLYVVLTRSTYNGWHGWHFITMVV